MEIIKKELDILNNKILSSFEDPLKEQDLKAFMNGKSKRIRSVLAILLLKSFGKELDDRCYEILLAGELIHNASLLHDDVLDEASLRRGVLTLNKKYSPKVSILTGNYLLTIAIERLVTLQSFTLIEDFKTCTKDMVKAELKQYFYRGSIPNKEEYIEICKNKTAKLFSTILRSVFSQVGLPIDFGENFGELFGVLFQIKNDLEISSAMQDDKNEIYTAIDILGIENTNYLLDNYKKDLKSMIAIVPDNIYKTGIEDLVERL